MAYYAYSSSPYQYSLPVSVPVSTPAVSAPLTPVPVITVNSNGTTRTSRYYTPPPLPIMYESWRPEFAAAAGATYQPQSQQPHPQPQPLSQPQPVQMFAVSYQPPPPQSSPVGYYYSAAPQSVPLPAPAPIATAAPVATYQLPYQLNYQPPISSQYQPLSMVVPAYFQPLTHVYPPPPPPQTPHSQSQASSECSGLGSRLRAAAKEWYPPASHSTAAASTVSGSTAGGATASSSSATAASVGSTSASAVSASSAAVSALERYSRLAAAAAASVRAAFPPPPPLVVRPGSGACPLVSDATSAVNSDDDTDIDSDDDADADAARRVRARAASPSPVSAVPDAPRNRPSRRQRRNHRDRQSRFPALDAAPRLPPPLQFGGDDPDSAAGPPTPAEMRRTGPVQLRGSRPPSGNASADAAAAASGAGAARSAGAAASAASRAASAASISSSATSSVRREPDSGPYDSLLALLVSTGSDAAIRLARARAFAAAHGLASALPASSIRSSSGGSDSKRTETSAGGDNKVDANDDMDDDEDEDEEDDDDMPAATAAAAALFGNGNASTSGSGSGSGSAASGSSGLFGLLGLELSSYRPRDRWELEDEALSLFLHHSLQLAMENSGPPPAPKSSVDSLTELTVKSNDHALINSECTICKELFVAGETLLVFACTGKHMFHSPCLKEWLSRRNTCPLCRFALTASAAATAAPTATASATARTTAAAATAVSGTSTATSSASTVSAAAAALPSTSAYAFVSFRASADAPARAVASATPLVIDTAAAYGLSRYAPPPSHAVRAAAAAADAARAHAQEMDSALFQSALLAGPTDDGTGLDRDEINTISSQTGRSFSESAFALRRAGNIIDAILALTP